MLSSVQPALQHYITTLYYAAKVGTDTKDQRLSYQSTDCLAEIACKENVTFAMGFVHGIGIPSSALNTKYSCSEMVFNFSNSQASKLK